MKTLIELFDQDRIKNVLAPILFKPETVIYLCPQGNFKQKWKNEIWDFLIDRGIKSNIEFWVMDARDGKMVDAALQRIKKGYSDIAFEITGGDDLLLTQVGSFCDANNIIQIYKDFEQEKLLYIEGNREWNEKLIVPYLTIEDVIKMSGGEIIGQFHYQPSGFKKEEIKSLRAICHVFLKNKQRWADFVYYLQHLGEDGLDAFSNGEVRCNNRKIPCNYEILNQLEQESIITNFVANGEKIRFTYTNGVFQEVLKIQGFWLELYVYFSALDSGYFNDVRLSTMIEWTPNDDEKLRNEVDLILLKNAHPIFVSCKMTINNNSAYSLYEIKTLCDRFGGGTSQALLITSDDVKSKVRNLFSRAKEIGVEILDYEDICNGQLKDRLAAIF